MAVLMKQPFYGHILIELVENLNACKKFSGEDIVFKPSQVLIKDVVKIFK